MRYAKQFLGSDQIVDTLTYECCVDVLWVFPVLLDERSLGGDSSHAPTSMFVFSYTNFSPSVRRNEARDHGRSLALRYGTLFFFNDREGYPNGRATGWSMMCMSVGQNEGEETGTDEQLRHLTGKDQPCPSRTMSEKIGRREDRVKLLSSYWDGASTQSVSSLTTSSDGDHAFQDFVGRQLLQWTDEEDHIERMWDTPATFPFSLETMSNMVNENIMENVRGTTDTYFGTGDPDSWPFSMDMYTTYIDKTLFETTGMQDAIGSPRVPLTHTRNKNGNGNAAAIASSSEPHTVKQIPYRLPSNAIPHCLVNTSIEDGRVGEEGDAGESNLNSYEYKADCGVPSDKQMDEVSTSSSPPALGPVCFDNKPNPPYPHGVFYASISGAPLSMQVRWLHTIIQGQEIDEYPYRIEECTVKRKGKQVRAGRVRNALLYGPADHGGREMPAGDVWVKSSVPMDSELQASSSTRETPLVLIQRRVRLDQVHWDRTETLSVGKQRPW
ncbi:hypothetical protein BV25DRAFT_1843348 [Artomyces pyxidatus]|uniref:Uncharacterized protein n=1 Tax=Artomyces pyxidatus TaxID=48021 RepID=A0ACB8SG56_9AGAM|nr:hypothetical protein BV25DRAFT_1843348 [Artomyces pyxidatus]